MRCYCSEGARQGRFLASERRWGERLLPCPIQYGAYRRCQYAMYRKLLIVAAALSFPCGASAPIAAAGNRPARKQ